MLEQGDFQFLREQAFGQGLAFLRQRSGLEFVAGGLDDLQLEAQLRESGAALGQDQLAWARARALPRVAMMIGSSGILAYVEFLT